MADAGLKRGVRVMGESPNECFVVGEHVTVAPIAGSSEWALTAYSKSLVAIQLSGLLGGDVDVVSDKLPNAESLRVGLERAVAWVCRRASSTFIQRFNDAFPGEGVLAVATIPENAVEIVDDVVAMTRALSVVGASVVDGLPTGAKRWLAGMDWANSRPVYSLKGKYRANIERSGDPVRWMGDWMLYDCFLADPYEQARSVGFMPYRRGVAVPSSRFKSGGYDIVFVVGDKSEPSVYLFHVPEAKFAKNFAWDLDGTESVDVSVTAKADGHYFRPEIRKVRMNRIFDADIEKAPTFLLGRRLEKQLCELDDATMRAFVQATGKSSALDLLFCKVEGELLFLNFTQARVSFQRGLKNIEFKRNDGSIRQVEVVAERLSWGGWQFVPVDKTFAGVFDACLFTFGREPRPAQAPVVD